jgi:hypothetical protein
MYFDTFSDYGFCLNLATLKAMQEMLQLQQQVPFMDRVVPRSTLNILITWLSWWCWWLCTPLPHNPWIMTGSMLETIEFEVTRGDEGNCGPIPTNSPWKEANWRRYFMNRYGSEEVTETIISFNFPNKYILANWIFVLFTKYLLHVSALTAPSLEWTLITSQIHLLIVGCYNVWVTEHGL